MQSICGLPVVSRGKDAKTVFRHPSHCRPAYLETTPTQQPLCELLVLPVFGNRKSQQTVILSPASFSDSALRATRQYSRHRARTCTLLMCPARVRWRTEPCWGQSESLRRLQAVCGLAGDGGMDGLLYIVCISLHQAALLFLYVYLDSTLGRLGP